MTTIFASEQEAQQEAQRLRDDGHTDAHVVYNHYRDDYVVKTYVDSNVEVPKRGDMRILFTLRIAGYTITAWDTYRTIANGSIAGRSVCGIKATKDGKIVFLTDAWSPSPLHSIDGSEAQHDACKWVADALEDETGGPLGCEASWRWENPETGAYDPAAARRARKASKAEVAR